MTISEEIKIQPIEQVINNAIAFGKQEGGAVAVWRTPGEDNIQLIVDFSAELQPTQDPLDSKAPGFVFAPFDISEDTYLVKADLHINLGNHQITTRPDYSVSTKTEKLLTFLEKEKSPKTSYSDIGVSESKEDKDKFIQLVNSSVKAIQNGQFQKVVPSRKKEIHFDKPLNVGNNFLRLTKAYPSAFISLVFVPQAGIWMGATPELLISVKDNIFKSVALAGTQKYEDGTSLSNVAWTQKEIEEQALVSRYIINCFKKIRLREFEEVGPKTVIAGNLLHLKTEYKVNMVATNFTDLGEVMLKLLHPTSAICGMPLSPAREFLLQHEHYDRKYFAGYLGPANFDNSTQLYVNLRCMHIEEDKATVFAGAGVTEDSQPEKEWEETEIKMNTLLNIIK
ncbi:isochorismate synthase [Fulvivirga sp. 29W222]|uniref:isochorismate synthase n=1 Tax=Fulvivirga marina TaxID=2494733 RepID=A0A937FWG6_9BACT|nr:isochorismate synthase [Fulvivirga marina]MBL6445917.1 isochorismate synthase [Fulvivirga marina]